MIKGGRDMGPGDGGVISNFSRNIFNANLCTMRFYSVSFSVPSCPINLYLDKLEFSMSITLKYDMI